MNEMMVSMRGMVLDRVRGGDGVRGDDERRNAKAKERRAPIEVQALYAKTLTSRIGTNARSR